MRIYSMTATFGKLEHETLRLEPGLNILEAPNEWGKSTWCAFLIAMLYGVETRVHSTKNTIADKERYAPWSGSPMSGRIELSWQGRDITIQRRTKGRIPMGDFSAFETQTGLAVPELTAQNCGEQLLGVEKAVFLRSAFLRGSDLAVESEDSLRRRLNALVTTGEESTAADDLEKKLKELKNRCRANRTTGLLPQAYQRRAQLEEELQTLQSLHRQRETMERQLLQLEERRSALELHRQTLDYRAGVEAGQSYARAAAELEAAAQRETLCREAVRQLPPREQLENRMQQLKACLQKKTALCQAAEALQSPDNVPESPGRAAADAGRYKRDWLLGWLLLAVAALWILAGSWLWYAEAESLIWLLFAAAGLCAAGGITLLILAVKRKKTYGGLPVGTWAENAQRRLREQTCAEALQQQLRSVNERIRELAEGKPEEEALQQLRQGLDAYIRWEEAQERLCAAQLAAELRKREEPAVKEPRQGDTLSYSRQETKQLLAQCQEQLRQLQLRLGECRGQTWALGKPDALQQELEKTNKRIAELEDTYAALEIALNTLAQSRAELQRRFAPQIVKKTQTLFFSLTGGRYGQLTMEEDLRLQVRAEGEDTLRSSLWRSEGTVDQLYLALRLAVASELIPHSPLILDDALVRFDDERLKLAMELLRQEAQNRQILLFTCQSREKTACNL